jgi:extradiol dioxygenase family protein
MAAPLFHLAIPVSNLAKCLPFYRDILRCRLGRSASVWQDLDFFGHQLVLHEVANHEIREKAVNPVDGHQVPVPHFGVILAWQDWHELADYLRKCNTDFIIHPYIRFAGQPGEQATMFCGDPEGNVLEFKSFRDPRQLFATA